MATATLPMNGKPRKQLSDQLDRLDEIIDVLGDGLSEAVVTAMRTGAQQAVKEALVEVLTHPEFLSALQFSTTVQGTAIPAVPTLLERLRGRIRQVGSATACLANAVQARFHQTVAVMRSKIWATCARGRTMLTAARSGGFFLSRLILTASLVGVLAGTAAYYSPLETLTALGAICGAAGTIFAQIGYRARRFLKGMMALALPTATRLKR